MRKASPIRILHVITGLGLGGAEGVLRRLVVADRGNHHLVVSLAGEGQHARELRQKGIPVMAFGLPRGPGALRGVFRLRRVITDFRPHVLQTWMYHADLLGGLVGKMSGVPVLWNLRNSLVKTGKTSWGTRMVVRINGLSSRFLPARILYNAAAQVAIHRQVGFFAPRMQVILNGFDTTRFRPLPRTSGRSRRVPGRPGRVPILGMIARWDPFKDHETLLQGLHLLKQRGESFRFLLVGSGMGTTNTDLVRMIRRWNLLRHVSLLGPQGDIPTILNRMDLHVLSSIAEAFPNVVGEAMACGIPCVTTNVGEAANIVGKTGWVVPPSDAKALANGILQALRAMRNRRAWLVRKRNARARIVRHYRLETMVKAYQQVWDEVASSGR